MRVACKKADRYLQAVARRDERCKRSPPPIKTMQYPIDYLMESIDIQGEILEEKTESRQPELSVEQKKRLAYRGKKLNEFLLEQIEHTFAPSPSLK